MLNPIPGEIDIEAVDPSPGHRAILERSELARFLRPSVFPAGKDQLLAVARDEGATDAVLDELAALPDHGHWTTQAEVWESLGHEIEHRTTEHEGRIEARQAEMAPESAHDEAHDEPSQLGLADAAIGVGVAVLQLGAVLVRRAETAVRTVLRGPSPRR